MLDIHSDRFSIYGKGEAGDLAALEAALDTTLGSLGEVDGCAVGDDGWNVDVTLFSTGLVVQALYRVYALLEERGLADDVSVDVGGTWIDADAVSGGLRDVLAQELGQDEAPLSSRIFRRSSPVQPPSDG
ncbi:MAG: hypothetical protein ACYTF0_08785 [Planctomycetota bacterium]|jgi:hypothetical protein